MTLRLLLGSRAIFSRFQKVRMFREKCRHSVESMGSWRLYPSSLPSGPLDITPLGANFQSRVSEYGVFGSGNQGILKLGSVDFDDAYRVPNKRLGFRFEMDPGVVVDEIWVAPFDGSTCPKAILIPASANLPLLRQSPQ